MITSLKIAGLLAFVVLFSVLFLHVHHANADSAGGNGLNTSENNALVADDGSATDTTYNADDTGRCGCGMMNIEDAMQAPGNL
jgi:hypothetical protein